MLSLLYLNHVSLYLSVVRTFPTIPDTTSQYPSACFVQYHFCSSTTLPYIPCGVKIHYYTSNHFNILFRYALSFLYLNRPSLYIAWCERFLTIPETPSLYLPGYFVPCNHFCIYPRLPFNCVRCEQVLPHQKPLGYVHLPSEPSPLPSVPHDGTNTPHYRLHLLTPLSASQLEFPWLRVGDAAVLVGWLEKFNTVHFYCSLVLPSPSLS